MTPPPAPSRLMQWLPTLGLLAWAVSLIGFLGFNKKTLTAGEVVLAVGLWCFALAVVARSAVRDMFGPVFFYDAVRTGRSRFTFVLRFLYVGVLALLMGGMYVSWLDDMNYFTSTRGAQSVPTAKLAGFAYTFFQVFAVVQYLVTAVLTPVYVAGAIAVEKERKTLEFLLATDLRNREIVFGKVASRVLNLLAFVFAGLPVVALLQLFGGIDPNELLGAFAATVITVFGLSALSIWLSVMMKKPRDAIMLAYLLIAAYVFLSFLIAILPLVPPPTGGSFWWQDDVKLLGYTFNAADFTLAFGNGNPGLGVLKVELAKTGRGGGPPIGKPADEVVFDFAVFWLLATAFFLAWSIFRVRSVTLAQAYGPVKQPRGAKARAARRHPDVGDNPVLWKEVFVDSGGGRGWLWKVINVLIVVLIFVWLPFIAYFAFLDPWSRQQTYSLSERWDSYARGMNGWTKAVVGAFTTLLFFAAAIRGAGAVSGEKDKDTWISLISTPMGADRILWGKWWGCLLSLRRSFFVLLCVYAVGMMTGAVHPLVVPVTLAATAVCTSAFAWIGLYCSMRAKNGLNATIQAFFATVFFAGGFWVALGCCCGFPLGLMRADNRWMSHAVQIILGSTPPMMVGGPLHRSLDESGEYNWDNQPFDFGADRGFGFYSVLLGIVVWFLFNGILMATCIDKFRGLTNRKPFAEPKMPKPKPEPEPKE